MSRHTKLTSAADMSVPPEDRKRRRKPGRIETPPAQMSHAQGARSRHWQREGERRMEAERERRLELTVQDGPGTPESVRAQAWAVLYGGQEEDSGDVEVH